MMQLSKGDKLYRINLTKKGEKFPKNPIDIREVEIAILSNCVELTANEAPKISELRQRMKMLDELDNLSDTDNYIDLSKSDIEMIKQSFEKTAGRRPVLWLRCSHLLDQLEVPNELKTNVTNENE